MGKVRYLAAGDSSVSVEFGNEISRKSTDRFGR